MTAKMAIMGDIYLDIQTGPVNKMPEWEGDLVAESIDFLTGGSACNTARYLGALGLKPRLFSSLGDCQKSKFQKVALKEEGLVFIDDSVVTIKESSCPTAVVIYGEGKRGYISNRGCLLKYNVNHLNLKLVNESSHLHIGGYFVLPAMQTTELYDFIKKVKHKNLTVSLDCQHDASLKWEGKNGNLSKILPLIDVFMPSCIEALGVAKAKTIPEAFVNLRKKMPKALLIVKNSDKGILYSLPGSESDQVVTVKTYPATATDATGAGDSFDAGFLFELERNGGLILMKKALEKSPVEVDKTLREKVEKALKFGCAMGSLCVQNKGAFVRGICDEAKKLFSE